MTSIDAFQDFLDRLDEAIDVEAHPWRWRRYYLDRCRDLVDLLPAEGSAWLGVADAYMKGNATDAELLDARVAAWSAIKGRDLRWDEPEVAAVRAVIFTLTPIDASEDQWYAFTVFVDFVRTATSDRRRDIELLRAAFGDLAPAILEEPTRYPLRDR